MPHVVAEFHILLFVLMCYVCAVMCFMALLLWVLTGLCDMSAAITFIMAILKIPTSTTTVYSMNDEEKYEFVQITCLRKISVIAIQIVRIGIAIGLLLSGTLFLSAAISLEDIILNAMVTFPSPLQHVSNAGFTHITGLD